MPNSNRKNYNSPKARERHCLELMQRHVEQFGYKASSDALRKIGSQPAKPTKTSGRPVEFDYGKLMELWLYVEEGRARLDLSVQAFCKSNEAEFSWFTGGLPAGHPEYDDPISKVIKGETLRRRYNEAVAFLKSDAELRTSSSKNRIAFPSQPVAMIWQAELQRRLSEIAA